MAITFILFMSTCEFFLIHHTNALDYRHELHDYELVEVRQNNQQIRNARDLSATIDQKHHLNETGFTIFSKQRKMSFQLKKNSVLISDQFQLVYQHQDGSRKFVRNEVRHCFYHGEIEGRNNSHVTVSTCNGLRGLIQDEDGKNLFIEPLHDNASTHILYNMKDLKEREHRECGHSHGVKDDDELLKMSAPEETNRVRMSRTKRDANTQWKYIEVVVVVDNRKHVQWGDSVTESENKAIEIMNYVDAIYKTMKTRVTVISVIVWNTRDEIEVTTSPSRTLDEFSKYTTNVIHGTLNIYNDNAQLISAIDFDGSTVGLAGVGVICGLASAAVNQDHNSNPAVSANTVAHELGHNLGFLHNDGSCTCSNSPCVMEAVSPNSAAQGFSSCTKAKFEQQQDNQKYPCLSDYPQTIFGPSRCGDGYKEDSEECDCGTEQDCKDSGADQCCDYATCKLQDHAECADGECCQNCRFKSQGTLCRDKMHEECDLKEYCVGNSSHCPRNFYIGDGKPCSNSEGYCFQGMCRTHTQQCEVLWGPNGYIAEEPCFNLNLAGNEFGHCGKEENNYTACPDLDRLCGKIQCQGKPGTELPTWPLLGTNRKIKMTTFFSGGKSYSCKAIKMSFPSELEDPTMTFDGTKCADNSVCIGYQCINMSSLQNIKTCDHECKNGGFFSSFHNIKYSRHPLIRTRKGLNVLFELTNVRIIGTTVEVEVIGKPVTLGDRHGLQISCSLHFTGDVCNNNGNCHCPYGFACPYCKNSGLGGSIDSGQGCNIVELNDKLTSEENKNLYLLLLVLIPLCIGALLFFLYRFKREIILNKVFPKKSAAS